jgi:hypothetical protein
MMKIISAYQNGNGALIEAAQSGVRYEKRGVLRIGTRRLFVCTARLQTLRPVFLLTTATTMVFDCVKQGRKERVSFFRRNANNKGAWRNYWATLRSDQRHRWLVKASKKVKGRKFSKIYVKGQELAFKFAGEVHWDWNDDIRIDYEVVLCMQK